jgi:hypothetical protein
MTRSVFIKPRTTNHNEGKSGKAWLNWLLYSGKEGVYGLLYSIACTSSAVISLPFIAY